jgi:hypothetical protein
MSVRPERRLVTASLITSLEAEAPAYLKSSGACGTEGLERALGWLAKGKRLRGRIRPLDVQRGPIASQVGLGGLLPGSPSILYYSNTNAVAKLTSLVLPNIPIECYKLRQLRNSQDRYCKLLATSRN